jgi:hypothetical protein
MAKPELKAAFDRGRFLRNIAEFGGKNYTLHEAELELGMLAGSLETLFKTDLEAVDTWNQARHRTLLEIKKRWLEMVGMASPAALKQLEKLMSRGIVQPAADLSHITSKQMQELTQKSRQTVESDWPKIHGLKRNTDGTYNLYIFLPWFEEFITRTRSAPAKQSEPEALRDKKAQMLDIELKEKLGRLLPRESVIAGIIGRHQLMLNMFDKFMDKVPAIVENQPLERIKKILEESFVEIRNEMAKSKIEMKLNDEQTEKLKELLNELSATDFTDDFKMDKATELSPAGTGVNAPAEAQGCGRIAARGAVFNNSKEIKEI